jgi:GTPase SAR1 family protein
VGPRGSGKSTLVNRITRVFDKDDDPFAPDRAQVSCKFYPFFFGGGGVFHGDIQLNLISSN